MGADGIANDITNYTDNDKCRCYSEWVPCQTEQKGVIDKIRSGGDTGLCKQVAGGLSGTGTRWFGCRECGTKFVVKKNEKVLHCTSVECNWHVCRKCVKKLFKKYDRRRLAIAKLTPSEEALCR